MSTTDKAVLAIAASVLLAAPQPAASQQAEAGPTACAGPASYRFDFWAGTWSVESRMRGPDGEWVETDATWRAEEILGGCAFIDFARGDFGRGPMRGMGSRYYEPESGIWYITWLSTRAPGRLQIWEGGFGDDGTATFLDEVSTPQGTLLSRIRWWDLRDDFAEWEHAVSRDGGETWQATWRMTFRRDESPSVGGVEESDAPDVTDDLEERLQALYHAGELHRGVELADSALAELEDAGTERDVTKTRIRLLVARGKLAATDAFTSNRSLDGALATLREAVEQSETVPGSPERADALLQLGFAEYVDAFLEGGEFAPIRGRFERSLEISRDLDDPERTARALFHVGLIHERLGETDAALARHTESLAIADACGCRLVQSYAQRHVGFARLTQDRPGDALQHFRRSLELREAVGFRVYLPYSNAAMADILVALERPSEAEPYALRAVELARSLGAPRTRTVALLSLAGVHRASGQAQAARRRYGEALQLATDIDYAAGVRAAREGLGTDGGP